METTTIKEIAENNLKQNIPIDTIIKRLQDVQVYKGYRASKHEE
jgi:hypothetical protein